MEQLIASVEDYCARAGRKPQWVLRMAYGGGWGVWEKWKAGEASPTVVVADRIYAWMAANPPAQPEAAALEPPTPEEDAA